MPKAFIICKEDLQKAYRKALAKFLDICIFVEDFNVDVVIKRALVTRDAERAGN